MTASMPAVMFPFIMATAGDRENARAKHFAEGFDGSPPDGEYLYLSRIEDDDKRNVYYIELKFTPIRWKNSN